MKPAGPIKNDSTIRYYGRQAKAYGMDVRAVDWGSRQSQTRRFEILAEIGSLAGKSVLDVGCGLGDLYPWLRGHARGCRYTGIDITPEMIELAHGRFPRADFRLADVASLLKRGKRFDYVLASGIFTKQRDRPLQAMKKTVRDMLRLARVGVAFNLLSKLTAHRERGEFHADPGATLTYCQTLTPWVALRHDYHPRDFTMYLYKNKIA